MYACNAYILYIDSWAEDNRWSSIQSCCDIVTTGTVYIMYRTYYETCMYFITCMLLVLLTHKSSFSAYTVIIFLHFFIFYIPNTKTYYVISSLLVILNTEFLFFILGNMDPCSSSFSFFFFLFYAPSTPFLLLNIIRYLLSIKIRGCNQNQRMLLFKINVLELKKKKKRLSIQEIYKSKY